MAGHAMIPKNEESMFDLLWRIFGRRKIREFLFKANQVERHQLVRPIIATFGLELRIVQIVPNQVKGTRRNDLFLLLIVDQEFGIAFAGEGKERISYFKVSFWD